MNLMSTKDNLYSRRKRTVYKFLFDKKVVDVFEDMIQRSVPGYSSILEMIGVFSSMYYQPNTNCYDLGCSLGAAATMIHRNIHNHRSKIIAVDRSRAMIRACRQRVLKNRLPEEIDFICLDIRDMEIKNASIVVLNFTLQFINLIDRDAVIKNIFEGLLPDGILILSEKINFSSHAERDFQIKSHHCFKKKRGYSDIEIEQKRASIKKILIPETSTQHFDRLRSAGFRRIYKCFQYFNFVSLIAFK